MASTTHVATCELENISLTLPPATLRNAAPQYPQINRKARYTAVECVKAITPEIKDATHGTRNVNKHIQMSGANATGNMHTKNRANEKR